METKKYFLITAFLLASVLTFSQSFNYQAVVRDTNNDIVSNQTIGVQVSILQGGPTGTNVYTETHNITSSQFGIISLAVGTGTTTDNFATITWFNQNFWMDVAVDVSGGTTYTSIGTSQLQHVPYALYAQTSGNTGVFTTNNGVTSNVTQDYANNDFVFGSDRLENDNSTTNDDSRFFFDKSKGALRAGLVTGSQWDDANVGNESIAMGTNVQANGVGAIAIGSESTAQATYSMTLGNNNQTLWVQSMVIGNNNIANAERSIALGTGLDVDSYGQINLGLYSTQNPGFQQFFFATDRLFVLGNGTDDMNRSDALTILKNGNTAFSGNVGIGTTTPETTYALNVNGDLNYSGTLTNISDRRYKNNISLLKGSLNKLKELNGVQYEMRHNEFPEMKFSEGTQFGVIAQDLEKVYPNLVKTNKEGFKSVNYTGLIPVLIEAVKEQQEEIDELEKQSNRIEWLEKNINALLEEEQNK